MRHHRMLYPLAVLAAVGIALAPASARAATPAPGATSAPGTSQSALIAAVKKAEHLRTFSSPATRSHHTKTAAPGVSTPNPNLLVAISAYQMTALSFELVATVSGLTTGGAISTITWGDQSSNTITLTSATPSFTISHSYSASGDYAITVSSNDGAGDVATNTLNVVTLGSELATYGPVRVLDTRSGLNAPVGPVAAGGTLRLKLPGTGVSGSAIPSGITAAVLNLTATQERAGGHLTVYSDQDGSGYPGYLPTTSNLNFSANHDVANLVIAPVGANGVVDIHNASAGSTQLVADVEGYYSATGTNMYAPVDPARILDTRHGTGTGGKIAQVPANASLTLKVAGDGVIPAGATAAALNVTEVDGTHDGLIIVYPTSSSGSVPSVSNINYGPNTTIANMATVALGTEGQVTFHNSGTGPVDLVVDALGYFGDLTPATGGSAYVPYFEPWRSYDSRTAGNGGTDKPLSAGHWLAFPMSFPGYKITANTLNITATNPTGNGFLAAAPYSASKAGSGPGNSTLNYLAGQTVPNFVVVSAGTEPDYYGDFDVGVYAGGVGGTDVIVDYFGIYLNS